VLGAWHGDELAGGVALYESDSRHGRDVTLRPLLYYNSRGWFQEVIRAR
jgi:hypothetical protein